MSSNETKSADKNDKGLFLLKNQTKFINGITWINHISDYLLSEDCLNIALGPDGPNNTLFPFYPE
jgi:hypothetical protein